MRDTYEEGEKSDFIKYRIEHAQEALGECESLYRNGFYKAAVTRLYYACYYVASALLLANNIEAKTHQGVRTMLSKHFIATGKLSSDYGNLFSQLMASRSESDYGDFVYFTADEVDHFHDRTVEFIKTIVELIDQSRP